MAGGLGATLGYNLGWTSAYGCYNVDYVGISGLLSVLGVLGDRALPNV